MTIKVLVEVTENGLVKARASVPARIAVINRPRLGKLRDSFTAENFRARLEAATRFISRPAQDAPKSRRDRVVARLLGDAAPVNAVGEAPQAPTTQEYSVPVTTYVTVSASSVEEAKALAVEDANDGAIDGGFTAGEPTSVVG